MTILAGVDAKEQIGIQLKLANGVQINIGFEYKAFSEQAVISAKHQATNITAEITGGEGQMEITASADNLLHWLSLARDWKPENERSCKKRITEHLDRHLAGMRQLHNLQRIEEEIWEEDANLRRQLWSKNWGDLPGDERDGCFHQDAVEIAEEYERESFAISVQKKVVYDIQCSWGGPSDGFLVEVDESEIVAITYYFKDWFDGARQELSGDDFDTAKRYIEQMVYLGE